jgi:hypothetical protein
MNKTRVFLLAVFATAVAGARQTNAAEVHPLMPLQAAAVSQDQESPMKQGPHAAWHSLVVEPDPKLNAQIHFYDKLNPVWWFRNLAEPVAPSWYRPDDPHRNLKYHLRNPGANFCRYVIGISDKKFVRSGRHPQVLANPNGGLNFAVSRRGLLVLPFVDYRFKKFEVYLGWREHGSFGVACRRQPRLRPPEAADKAARNAAEVPGGSPSGRPQAIGSRLASL